MYGDEWIRDIASPDTMKWLTQTSLGVNEVNVLLAPIASAISI